MKEIEIPFGAKDSELKGWEYTIPEGMEAEIKDGKIVVREKESEDERIKKGLIRHLEELRNWKGGTMSPIKVSSHYDAWIAYLEKQKESTWTEEDESFRKHILPRILNPTSWTLEQKEADRGLLKEFVERQKNKWGEKQKEQKPEERFEEAREKYQVEWSEEDIDKMVNERARKSGTTKTEMHFYRQGIEDTLKNLRPSWKPSEEQKERSHFVRQVLSDGHMKKFIEIYSDECDCKVGDVVKAIIRKKD